MHDKKITMAIFIITSLIVFEVLLIIVHLAVYATLAAAFGIGGVWLKIVFVILALTFVSAASSRIIIKGTIVDWYYTCFGVLVRADPFLSAARYYSIQD